MIVAGAEQSAHAVALALQRSELRAEWVTAIGAVLAACFAACAVFKEGQLLKAAKAQVEATSLPIVVLERRDDCLVLENLGSGPAHLVVLTATGVHVKVSAMGTEDRRPMTVKMANRVVAAGQFTIRFRSVAGTSYISTGRVQGQFFWLSPQVPIKDAAQIKEYETAWETVPPNAEE